MPSSSTETPTTKPTTSHRRVLEQLGDVGEQRRGAGDLDAGRDVGAQVVDQAGGSLVGRSVGRLGREDPERPVG